MNNRWLTKCNAYFEFIEKNHRFPKHNSEDLIEDDLNSWARDQRASFSQGTMNKETIDFLMSKNFIFDKKEYNWFQKLNECKEAFSLKKEKFSCLSEIKAESSYCTWIYSQFAKMQEGKLSERQKIAFNEFYEKYRKTPRKKAKGEYYKKWMKRVDEYFEFLDREGKEPYRGSKEAKESSLAVWAEAQRRLKKSGELDSKKEKVLDKLNFSWNTATVGKVEKEIEDFLKFLDEKHRYPIKGIEEEKEMYDWVAQKRKKKLKTTYEILEKIGFAFDVWDENYYNYSNFIELHNDFPSITSKESFECFLARWKNSQVSHYRKGELEEEKVELLREIGVELENWTTCFENLNKFVNENHRFPNSSSEDERKMHNWYLTQVYLRQRGMLMNTRDKRLKAVEKIIDTKKR